MTFFHPRWFIGFASSTSIRVPIIPAVVDWQEVYIIRCAFLQTAILRKLPDGVAALLAKLRRIIFCECGVSTSITNYLASMAGLDANLNRKGCWIHSQRQVECEAMIKCSAGHGYISVGSAPPPTLTPSAPF